jgi:hypothetical protein
MKTEHELFWTGLAREIVRNQISQKNARKRFRGQVSVFPNWFGVFARDCTFKTVCFCFGNWMLVSKGRGWIVKLAMWQISNENKNALILSVKVENISPATKSNCFRYWKKSKAEQIWENETCQWTLWTSNEQSSNFEILRVLMATKLRVGYMMSEMSQTFLTVLRFLRKWEIHLNYGQ